MRRNYWLWFLLSTTGEDTCSADHLPSKRSRSYQVFTNPKNNHFNAAKVVNQITRLWLQHYVQTGKDNVVGDPLSRLHEQPQPCHSAAISILVPQWKEEVRHSWNQGVDFIDTLAELAVNPPIPHLFLISLFMKGTCDLKVALLLDK